MVELWLKILQNWMPGPQSTFKNRAAHHTKSYSIPWYTLPVRSAASLPLCTHWRGIRGRCFVYRWYRS